ncbi:hypothetical protein VB715_07335 [Crocosphaera sp. UHCC 0190]|uniref:hypothetical protein n=1 Tax=Crocosphaera sp. UHCC 0190 TaxID=3110246 RepID=UPI002B1EF5E5|nr:hypothetical protein [Crocosphaera sp. UHCC 0190]MEA5509572.1 hypothetical protein [Crocosphaera sp. UHCC 0190]
MIPFTDREIKNAWRQNKLAYQDVQTKTNAHRLLLFYSVECGLKAVIMKRQNKNCTDLCKKEFEESKHNINKLLDFLKAGKDLKLPNQLNMRPLKQNEERKFTAGDINQMWRYGGCSEDIKDDELEKKLIKILTWIEQELGRL